MKPYLLSFLFILLFLTSNAQNYSVDSLKQKLTEKISDTSKLKTYHFIAKYYQFKSTDSLNKYLKLGLSLSSDIKNPKWIATFNYIKALYIELIGSREEAIKQNLIAKSLFEEINDTINIVKIHAALVSRYSEIGNLKKSLEHYKRGLSLLPSSNLKMKASLNNRIGIVYANQEELETAMRYFQLNIPLFKSLNDNYGLGFTYLNIGIIQDMIGIELDSALYNLEEGLKYHRLADKPSALAGNLGEIASYYINRRDFDNALKYVLEAIEIFKALNQTKELSTQYSKLAEIHRKLEEYPKAIDAAEVGLRIAEKSQSYNAMKDLLGILATSSYELKDFENAYLFENRRVGIRDSLFNNESKKIAQELEQKYEAGSKQAQIELKDSELSNQRALIIGIIIFTLLLLAFITLLYRVSIQRKKSNKQLQQLNNSKSRFFANISHELRTPLTLILAPIESAIEKVKSSSAKDDLKLAYSNSKKLLTLVNEILDLSKLESGKMELKESTIPLEPFLRRVFFSYHSLAQLKGFILSFSYHLEEDLMVKLDADKFEKVLNNLLSNAFKYSKNGGVITLRAGKEKGNLKIEITDSGKGIPAEQLDRIFERFYQAEGENEPLQGGTGIGLAYAKEISLLFGGTLEVTSKIDEGSNFIFSLPLKKSNEKIVSTEGSSYIDIEKVDTSKNYPISLSESKAKILVVEDNPEMSQFLVDSLSQDFHCSTAMDGVQALEYLNSGKQFDLITSDIMMPNMDGFEFLEKTHQIDAFKKTPFILLTARAMEEDKIKGLQLGVDDYLTKPFSTKELIARIHNLLKNKSVREQLPIETEAETVKILSHEEKLIEKAKELVIEHLSDGSYRIPDFASDLAYSPRQLERILKKNTGLSPVEFMREIRLQKAYTLLETRQFATVSEVRYHVGIENASHFAKKFQERFGKNPKEMMG